MVNCIIFTSITITAVPAATSSSDAIAYMEGNNSGLSQLLLYSVSNPIFCLLVAYLSVGFVLLLCPSIERLLYTKNIYNMIIPVGTVFSIQIYTSASSTVNIC